MSGQGVDSDFETKWKETIERLSRSCVVAPRVSSNLSSADGVAGYVVYLREFEQKNAKYWKWVLVWLAYPILDIPLNGLNFYSRLRKGTRTHSPLVHFIMAFGTSFLIIFAYVVGLSLFLPAVMQSQHAIFGQHPLIWMHLQCVFVKSLILLLNTLRKNGTGLFFQMACLVLVVCIYLLPNHEVLWHFHGTCWHLLYMYALCSVVTALNGRRRTWDFPLYYRSYEELCADNARG